MADIVALIDYFKKLQRAIDNADLTFFKYKILKKTKIDDLLVCTLAVLPDCFKRAMKKRLNTTTLPSVSCYNRLTKVIKKPFVLNKDYYIVDYGEINSMIKTIKQSIERDIMTLEREEN